MSDLLWALWGFIQHANENPRDDFWTYALGRLEQCKTRLGNADFGRHLDIVRGTRERRKIPSSVTRAMAGVRAQSRGESERRSGLSRARVDF
jgi:hypothetical protein